MKTPRGKSIGRVGHGVGSGLSALGSRRPALEFRRGNNINHSIASNGAFAKVITPASGKSLKLDCLLQEPGFASPVVVVKASDVGDSDAAWVSLHEFDGGTCSELSLLNH